ncbi:YaaL family protein [Bacillus chungangensis]|uniref:DUF2508 domain-containing protein n=1 Tax=Bacillus chungangensis TaxID=587633 RepID=A0ABT9WSR6_9BACI|nr:YaaL family protein [Bacillus chungangensis]MDQ0176336.1 hypothetical protein [Bacillus chungangensis]
MFSKKRKLRRTYDDHLMELIEDTKETWLQKKKLMELSFGHHEQLSNETKVVQATYFFLLREVKKRKIFAK